MIVLDYRDSRPLYQQVKDSLRRMMLTGLLEPDEKLPSVRSLATQLAINPNTIQRAYAELEAEGYIYSVAGRGSFVSAGDGEHLRRIAELTGRLVPLLEELEDVCDHVGILNHGKVLLERSLSDLQDNTVKLQVAYQGVTEPPLPAELNILHRSHVGRVYTYIVRGSSQEIMRRMQITEPVLLESIPLTLEEIFIYELGGVDYAAKDILL